MAKDRLADRLAVILHADVAGSTELIHQDKQLAHERIRDGFQRFSNVIERYHGQVLELRGDALLASFERGSEAVAAALAFQTDQSYQISRIQDEIRPHIRVGISVGEVVIADDTVTGAGVVQAQRVEQLAHPGGICITASIHESLSKRMPFEFESLGEQELKGFDHAVHVYRVELNSTDSIPVPTEIARTNAPSRKRGVLLALAAVILISVGGAAYWIKSDEQKVEAASIEHMAYPLPDKPSIAVLPFTNMSDDPKQEYFVDGMTEDLITDISNISGLFVIARNSVFTYKGKAVKVVQVAEELGVRYVLEGSVRRAGDQVRINAQLIDATTGRHLWAERYDGELSNVFALQDQVTSKIIAALEVKLTGDEKTRRAETETKNPKAYDALLQGWEHYRRSTPDDFSTAIAYLELAVKLDPNYGRAYAALAAVYWNSLWNGWWHRSFGLTHRKTLELARRFQRKALENPNSLAYQITSEITAYYAGPWADPNKAIMEADQAIALNKNDPAGYLAMATALIRAGQPDAAKKQVRTAMRLDPHYPPEYLLRLAQIQLVSGKYDDAATTLEKAIARNPGDDWHYAYLAAAYGHLGRYVDAHTNLKKANELRAEAGRGQLTLAALSDQYQGIANGRWVGDRKILREGLDKAGVESGDEWLGLVKGKGPWTIEGATMIDSMTAKQLHDRGIVFVDVGGQYRRGHIPNAQPLEFYYDALDYNEVRLAQLVDKKEELVVYDAYGTESYYKVHATAMAVSWGFEKVYYFADGLPAWIAAGYPIEIGN